MTCYFQTHTLQTPPLHLPKAGPTWFEYLQADIRTVYGRAAQKIRKIKKESAENISYDQPQIQ